MKRRFILVATALLLVSATVIAEEAVLIDFNKLKADMEISSTTKDATGNDVAIKIPQNRRTVMDYSAVAGATFTDDQKSLMRTSLALDNWEVVLNSSARNVASVSVSRAKSAPVSQTATKYTGETLLGIRVNFPTWNSNANATIKPPFEIPSYEPLAEIDDAGAATKRDATEAEAKDGIDSRFQDGYGVVKNVGVIKSLAVTTYGMNFPHSLYILLRDANNQESRYFAGYLNFDGWKQLVWSNPQYVSEVRTREIRLYPVYPTALPQQVFAGFLVTRDASHDGGDFVAYFKDVKIIYDKAVLNTQRDFEDEDLWGIQTQKENDAKNLEVSRFGGIQVLRFLEKEKMAVESGFGSSDTTAAATPATAFS